ncbi:winged helix-turn-helix domain-containing protein [Solwaraspora sp. WMMD792]|uniref:winged helix-turn-helix domain-containing protein n=1 Tax=Solwaraspora sp. WMMD792 TaxID=3016099 RepID=UPI00241773C3|nr:winged helix-turn-helix domain-containing protein [Solwaraspora sp. WMMD792]MDG4770840.1 winged helix-turn-helix domain-containing protein [Solwaraspora sp. WMMD792]
MSVSPASSRAGWSGLPPSGAARPPAAPRRGTGPAMATVTVTVSIPLTAGEEALSSSARQLLEAARELVERGEATVEMPAADAARAQPGAVLDQIVAGRDGSGPTPAAGGVFTESATRSGRTATVTVPALHVMVASRTVLLDGEPLLLTRLEFDLLLHLVENPRRVFTRLQLLAAVWGYEHTGVRTVDVHIRRLRGKVGNSPLITTVYGVGYRLADDVRVSIDTAG